MPIYRKLVGVHSYRKGDDVFYVAPGELYETTEANLRKFDPQLITWEFVSDSESEVELPVPAPTAVMSRTKGTADAIVKRELKVVQCKDKSGCDVVDKITGVPINGAPMSRKEAQALLDDIVKKQEVAFTTE